MAVPVIPIIKKAVTVVLTNKKARNAVIGIVLGVIVIVMAPIIIVMGIFSGDVDINTDRLQDIIRENNTEADTYMSAIEEQMSEAGYTELQIEEAKLLYAFALFDKTEDEEFITKLMSCYSTEEQTDESLVANVNATFGTDITVAEYSAAVQSIREKYQTEQEENTTQ